MSLMLFKEKDHFKLVLPSLLAVILFVVSVFGIILPGFKTSLLERKKETIQELTRTVWNLLDHYEKSAQAGKLSIDEGKTHAIKEIRELRYGPEDKDYFWINDMNPRMVMHPYVPELDGQDLSGYADPAGKHLFVDFVKTVQQNKEGFVPYMWQWKDDPNRVVNKLSYVKLFEPWGWIVGTGIYLDDIEREITSVTRKFTTISLVILGLVVLVSAYIINQGMQTTRMRKKAEDDLKKHHEQLEITVIERTAELEKALSEVKQLSGLLPICASCKKIRDTQGYWNQIEAYIRDHSEAEFTHSICEECAEKLYPGFSNINNKRKTSN
jgi:signal transduction histidine kinase